MATTAAVPETSAASSTLRRLLRLAVLLAVLVAAAVWGWRWWQIGRFIESTDNAYLRADITVLSPRIGGEIVALKVRDNQKVAAGDLLLEIDRRDYAARVDSARAAVAEARAALAGNGQQRSQQDAAINEVRAQLVAARASERQAAQELERAQTLLRDGVATRQRLDNAEAAHKNAVAGVARATAGVQSAERALTTLADSSRARLEAALAASEAQLSLGRDRPRGHQSAGAGRRHRRRSVGPAWRTRAAGPAPAVAGAARPALYRSQFQGNPAAADADRPAGGTGNRRPFRVSRCTAR